MTRRVDCTPAPGPLEEYAVCFDDLFTHAAQRRGLRAYLVGMFLLRDRTKTLTGLAEAVSSVAAQEAPVQRLQFFLSVSMWDAEAVNARRRLELTWAYLRHHAIVVVNQTFDMTPALAVGSAAQKGGAAGERPRL